MAATDKMLSRKEGSVGYLTFNNLEKRNAVSLDMWEAAEGFMNDFRDDKSIRVVVVSGAGGKAFVSGADISKFEDERASKQATDITKQLIVPMQPSTPSPSRPSP